MRLWVDDVRERPETFDVTAKTYAEAVAILSVGDVEHISIDHDLGGGPNGYALATWIEEQARVGKIPRMTWHSHSANPSGRELIGLAMRSAEKFWGEKR